MRKVFVAAVAAVGILILSSTAVAITNGVPTATLTLKLVRC
jgi:hypothetical protein